MRFAASIILSAAFLLLGFDVSAFEVPERSETLAGYDRESVEKRMSARRLGGLEGLWVYPEERMTFAVEQIPDDGGLPVYRIVVTDVFRIGHDDGGLPVYRIVVTDSENVAIDCGSVAGYMQESADPKKLRLWFYSLVDARHCLAKPVECVATVTADGVIAIQRPKLKFRVSVNLTRFLPSLFGGLRIYPRMEKESIEPGMRKVWPVGDETVFVVF